MGSTNTIKVRHVDFGLEKEIPNNWFKGNFLITHFVNSFHLIFPDGEKYFIRSVKAHEEFVQDPELKKRVKAFIAQEIIHGNEHKTFWENLKKKGYDIDTFLKLYNSTTYEFLEPNLEKVFGAKHGLAVTVALEHFTASLAEFAFKDLNELEGVPENMRQMLLWHASEEIEHKSVAFDVLKAVDDSYALRMRGLLHATITLSVYTIIGFVMFLLQEIKKGTFISPFEFWEFFTHFISLARTMGKEIGHYMQPDFHPDQVANEHLAQYFFEKYKVEKVKLKVAV
jgi:predicted metal-dependent hydrolase